MKTKKHNVSYYYYNAMSFWEDYKQNKSLDYLSFAYSLFLVVVEFKYRQGNTEKENNLIQIAEYAIQKIKFMIRQQYGKTWPLRNRSIEVD